MLEEPRRPRIRDVVIYQHADAGPSAALVLDIVPDSDGMTVCLLAFISPLRSHVGTEWHTACPYDPTGATPQSWRWEEVADA